MRKGIKTPDTLERPKWPQPLLSRHRQPRSAAEDARKPGLAKAQFGIAKVVVGEAENLKENGEESNAEHQGNSAPSQPVEDAPRRW